MPLIQSKQVSKLVAGRVYITGYSYPAAASSLVTAALTTAVATAGDNNSSVPLQQWIANTQAGFVVTGNNRVEVYSATTKMKLTDGTAANNEVYGRLTLVAGAYNLSLYSLVNGVETAYTPGAVLSIDFEPQYVFTFEKLPADFATGLKARYVGDDPVSAGSRVYTEVLTIATMSIVPALTNNYTTGTVYMNVNGQVLHNLGALPAFSVAAGTNAVTWSAANAGFDLTTTDNVQIEYPY